MEDFLTDLYDYDKGLSQKCPVDLYNGCVTARDRRKFIISQCKIICLISSRCRLYAHTCVH